MVSQSNFTLISCELSYQWPQNTMAMGIDFSQLCAIKPRAYLCIQQTPSFERVFCKKISSLNYNFRISFDFLQICFIFWFGFRFFVFVLEGKNRKKHNINFKSGSFWLCLNLPCWLCTYEVEASLEPIFNSVFCAFSFSWT